ncbi:MAG: glycosyltransferase family 8 protein [Candidatus Gastranaerophilales bacterium]
MKPAFNNAANIVMSCSEEYAPYLSVCLQSLKDNTSSKHNYDIIILENLISNQNKNKLKTQIETSNISLRFLKIEEKMLPQELETIYSGRHYSIESFFRILMPNILVSFDKILYIDVDTLPLKDVYLLFSTDLEGNTIGGCRDAIMCGWSICTPELNIYLKNTLGIKDAKEYFQAGVMLFDCKQYRKKSCASEIINLLNTIEFEHVDQCALNKYFKNNVKYLNIKWNYENENLYAKSHGFIEALSVDQKEKYFDAKNEPYIVHYISSEKPWLYFNIDFAEIWWEYAKKSPFYNEIVKKYNANREKRKVTIEKKLQNVRVKLLKYRILNIFTLGLIKNFSKNIDIKQKDIENIKKTNEMMIPID